LALAVHEGNENVISHHGYKSISAEYTESRDSQTHGIEDHASDLANLLDLLSRGTFREFRKVSRQTEREVTARRVTHEDDVLE
jgi:hypothetical protein